MFIRNCLTDRKQLKVVRLGERVADVLEKMEGHLSLPCVDEDDKFLGMVSKRTIFDTFVRAHEKGISYTDYLAQAIDDSIDRTVPTLAVEDPFEDTIPIIIRFPFVPIVKEGKLQGIVKRGDVNGALSIAFATNVPNQRILLGIADMEGALQRLFTVTHRLEINVITAVPFDAGPHSLNRRLILKVSPTNKLSTLVQQLEKAGFLIIEVSE